MLLFDNCQPTSQGESTRVPVRVVLALQVLPHGREERVAEVGGGQGVLGPGLAAELLVVVVEVLTVEDMLGGGAGPGPAQLRQVVVIMRVLLLLLLLLLGSHGPAALVQDVVNTRTAQQRPPAGALTDQPVAHPGTTGAPADTPGHTESTPDTLGPSHDLPAHLRQETPHAPTQRTLDTGRDGGDQKLVVGQVGGRHEILSELTGGDGSVHVEILIVRGQGGDALTDGGQAVTVDGREWLRDLDVGLQFGLNTFLPTKPARQTVHHFDTLDHVLTSL